nr:hypothetical protein [Methylomarinum sp. Ch1-1]MDP4522567.1 hypothetical protein [Methylomarinum sp. Ch1-1]
MLLADPLRVIQLTDVGVLTTGSAPGFDALPTRDGIANLVPLKNKKYPD